MYISTKFHTALKSHEESQSTTCFHSNKCPIHITKTKIMISENRNLSELLLMDWQSVLSFLSFWMRIILQSMRGSLLEYFTDSSLFSASIARPPSSTLFQWTDRLFFFIDEKIRFEYIESKWHQWLAA